MFWGGTLQVRPAGMPTGVWSPVSASVTNWATNGGSYTGITNSDIMFFWPDGSGGTLSNFLIYGQGKYFQFLFTDPGVPWYAGMPIEYLYSFSSGGGTHIINQYPNTYTSGYNDNLPN